MKMQRIQALLVLSFFVVPLLPAGDCDPSETLAKMLRAKGGEERLLGLDRIKEHSVSGLGELYSVFLDGRLLWIWNRPKDRRFPGSVKTVALANRLERVHNRLGTRPERIERTIPESELDFLLGNLVVHFVKTKWTNPSPIACTTSEDGLTHLIAKSNSSEFEFALDARYLPKTVKRTSYRGTVVYNILSHQVVDGITLPSSVTYSWLPGRVTRIKYDFEFNAPGRPDLEMQRLMYEDGPEAWRSGSRR